jgi:hypothetical protein
MSTRWINMKYFWGVERGRCVGLTSPPSVSWLSIQCGSSNAPQPYRPPRTATSIALFLRLTSPPSLSWLSIQCGISNVPQPYRPPRTATSIALLLRLTSPPSVSWLSIQCGSSNVPQPYRPPWTATSIALLFTVVEEENWQRKFVHTLQVRVIEFVSTFC